MAGLAGGLALNAAAFDLWCGRKPQIRIPVLIATVMPIGYAIGFASYPFRVGWANGLLTLQMGFLVASVWRKPVLPVGRWRWLLVVSLLAQMTVTVWRGALGAFFTESYPTFLAPHPVNYAFAIIANATMVLSLMAVLLAHRDEAARELERFATVDSLTGVLNRRAWMSLAATEMAVSVRYGHPVAVLMIDLDHFKLINDTHGHDAGDRALAFIARALQSAVRPGDLVGRYGGEEFCVLMTHADNAAASAFDVRMRDLPDRSRRARARLSARLQRRHRDAQLGRRHARSDGQARRRDALQRQGAGPRANARCAGPAPALGLSVYFSGGAAAPGS